MSSDPDKNSDCLLGYLFELCLAFKTLTEWDFLPGLHRILQLTWEQRIH